MTAGGGGWGDPFDRPAADVLDDVLDGFVSPESALRDYGVVIETGNSGINEKETEKLRQNHQRSSAMFHRLGQSYDGVEKPLPE